jgi:hypothetical protein
MLWGNYCCIVFAVIGEINSEALAIALALM